MSVPSCAAHTLPCPCPSAFFELIHVPDLNGGCTQNREQRWCAYTKIARLLGYWQRTQLPDCAVAAVRRAWPEASGQYTGYIAA